MSKQPHLEIDPEILADLRLREETLRDPNRRRRDAGLPVFDLPEFVRLLPCFNCGAACELNDIGQARLDQFNAVLRRRGEPDIDEKETLMCLTCRKKWDAMKANHNRKRVEEMGKTVRSLKASKNPDGEDAAWTYVDKNHPDPTGLREWIRSNRDGGKRRRARPEDVSG